MVGLGMMALVVIQMGGLAQVTIFRVPGSFLANEN
jgi:hypothetical protein